jgi:hypothetical protein
VHNLFAAGALLVIVGLVVFGGRAEGVSLRRVADDFTVATAAPARGPGSAEHKKHHPTAGPSASAGTTLPPLVAEEADAAPRAPVRDAGEDAR